MSRLTAILRLLSRWLFWPGVLVIAWGELTPNPPDLGEMFGWDKLEHFTAYFGLAGMATMAIGPKPKLYPTILDIILLSGLLELLQAWTGRDPEILDFAANSMGALLGLGAGMAVWRLTGLAGQSPLD
jgi:VanZ family protein